MVKKTGNSEDREYKAVNSKITWRLIPLLFVCYIIAYIDRINVGFAKLQLREVFGVDEALFGSIYGLGAGLFFIGYFLFEVPSNLILQRVGARIWIARIMIVWGLLASSMMFMKSTTFFYVMRFLLGVAEAGFFPGIILYLTYWFPARERAHTIAIFATGAIIAGIIGSPVSGALLELDGLAGLKGWQWLFLIEGIPAVLLGFVVFFFLPDKPSSARWLSSQEKDILDKRIKEDELLKGEMTHTKLREALTDSRVWLLCLMYFLLNVGGYGYELWMPTIIRNLSGASYSLTGFINAVPYIVAGVVMLLVSKHSDLTGERRWYVFFGAVVSAVGFAFSAWFKNPFFAIIALTVAFAGLKSTVGPFWAMGTSFLSGSAAAGGIAIINSVGNLGGFTGPVLVGFISGKTGNNVYSLLLLGFVLLIMGMLALTVKKRNIQLH